MVGERGNGRIKSEKSNSKDAIYFKNFRWSIHNSLREPKISLPDELEAIYPKTSSYIDILSITERIEEFLGILTTLSHYIGWKPHRFAKLVQSVTYHEVKISKFSTFTLHDDNTVVGVVEQILECTEEENFREILLQMKLFERCFSELCYETAKQTGKFALVRPSQLEELVKIVPENLDPFVQLRKRENQRCKRIQYEEWNCTHFSGNLKIVPTFVQIN